MKLSIIHYIKFLIIGLLYTGYGFVFYHIFDGLLQAINWDKKLLFVKAWCMAMLSIPLLIYLLVYALLPHFGIYFDSGKHPFSLFQFLFRLLMSSILVNFVTGTLVGIKAVFRYLAEKQRANKFKKKSDQLKIETAKSNRRSERLELQLESRHIAPHFVKNFVALSYQQNLKNDPKLMEAYFLEFTSLLSYMLDSDNLNKGVSAEDECDMLLCFTKMICSVYGEQAVQFNKPLTAWKGQLPAGSLLLPMENALKYGIWRKGHCGLRIQWENNRSEIALTFTNPYDMRKRATVQSLGTGLSLMKRKIMADEWPIAMTYSDRDAVFVFQLKISRI